MDETTEKNAGLGSAKGNLRDIAVAIDPPPPGAVGIRDLLRILEALPAGLAEKKKQSPAAGVGRSRAEAAG